MFVQRAEKSVPPFFLVIYKATNRGFFFFIPAQDFEIAQMIWVFCDGFKIKMKTVNGYKPYAV